MTQIDDAIRQALSAEDALVLERFSGEQPLLQQVFSAFNGQNRWLNVFGWLIGFAAFGAAVYCGWRFLNAPDLREMMIWGAGMGGAWFSLGLIKLWFWLELHRNATLRELKRLELQVARLAARGVG